MVIGLGLNENKPNTNMRDRNNKTRKKIDKIDMGKRTGKC